MATPGSSFLLLSDDDVRQALGMREAIDVNAAAFKDLAAQRAVCPDRHLVPVAETDGGCTLFKPAYIPAAGALGLKVVSVRPRNADVGLPTIPATIMTFDETTGMLSGVLAAT